MLQCSNEIDFTGRSLAEKAEQRLNNNDEKDVMAMGLNKLKQTGLDSEEVSQITQR